MQYGKSHFLSLSHNFVISRVKCLVQILSEVPSIDSIQWPLAKPFFDFNPDYYMNFTNLRKKRAARDSKLAKRMSSKLTLPPASKTYWHCRITYFVKQMETISHNCLRFFFHLYNVASFHKKRQSLRILAYVNFSHITSTMMGFASCPRKPVCSCPKLHIVASPNIQTQLP